jgi:hypothetical protein
MAQMIREYKAAPDAERWNRIAKQELIDLIEECRQGASRETNDIALRSWNETLEEAEETLREMENGSLAWAAQDEDGWYFAVGEQRFDDDQAKVCDAEVAAKNEWYDEHPDFNALTDEKTDEAIAAELDGRDLRRGAKFDSLASGWDFHEAVKAGLDAWAATVGEQER